MKNPIIMQLFRNIFKTNYFSLSGLSRLTGIHQGQLSHYVTGHRNPSKQTIQKIDNYFVSSNILITVKLLVNLHKIISKNMETAGIYIEHNSKGAPTFARIDLKKYGAELKDFFSSKGISVEKSPYDPEFVAKIRRAEKQPSVKVDIDNLWK